MPPSKAKSSRRRNPTAARIKKRSLEKERADKENAGSTVQSPKPRDKKKKQRKVPIIKDTRDREAKTTTRELSTLDSSEHDQQSDLEEVQILPGNLQDETDARPVSSFSTPAEQGEPLPQSITVETPNSVPTNSTNTLTELLMPLILPNFQIMPSAQSSIPDPASATPPKPSPTAELAIQLRLAAAVCECLTQRTQAAEGEATVADSLALATAGMVAEHPHQPYKDAANTSARKAYEAKYRLAKLREQEAEARLLLEDLVQHFNEAKAFQRRTGEDKGKTR